MTLNTIQAERYTAETIHRHTKRALIGTAYVRTDYTDVLVIAVPFTIDGETFLMDVWGEPDGTIYGEW